MRYYSPCAVKGYVYNFGCSYICLYIPPFKKRLCSKFCLIGIKLLKLEHGTTIDSEQDFYV